MPRPLTPPAQPLTLSDPTHPALHVKTTLTLDDSGDAGRPGTRPADERNADRLGLGYPAQGTCRAAASRVSARSSGHSPVTAGGLPRASRQADHSMMQRPDAPASCSRWPRQGGSPVGALGRALCSGCGMVVGVAPHESFDVASTPGYCRRCSRRRHERPPGLMPLTSSGIAYDDTGDGTPDTAVPARMVRSSHIV